MRKRVKRCPNRFPARLRPFEDCLILLEKLRGVDVQRVRLGLREGCCRIWFGMLRPGMQHVW